MIELWVALAGGLGAGARLMVDGAVRRRWATTFPVGTLLINVGGSMLLGVLAGLVLFHGQSDNVQVIVGICGGCTTFSTTSVETVRLAQQRLFAQAVTYAVGTLGVTVLAGAAGLGPASL